MLGWALVFFLIAIVAAGLGFTGIAGASAGIAKILADGTHAEITSRYFTTSIYNQ